MKSHLKQLLEMLEGVESIHDQQLEEMKKIIQSVDKDLTIAEFRLERTEKVKRTTSILLEETIEELEQKRLAVENLALESSRQASLDRIRAEIASMRTTNDLQQITPLIWEELKKLKIPFIRCGLFIMDEEEENIHTYLSTPKGNSIAVLHLPFKGIPLAESAVKAWKNQTAFHEQWDQQDFNQWTGKLMDQGYIESKENYESGVAPNHLELHFLPFKQGMLYIGNTEQLSEENLKLGLSLAEAFSVAYDRYEDFKKLELAKLEVEKTLKDLKEAQKLLIQSEKMASLGELTAGIAHEIQNPLNFVINFSSMANELLDELKAEKFLPEAERDPGLEEEILEDIAKNLDKINQHGKRADSIVKGMLQHSRSSGGEKLEANINALVDEYLRLSYHGLRAKDKTFNADFVTELDSKLPKIKIIRQDMGRVFLNLINNAFFAVNEKRIKHTSNGYKPQVKISSRMIGESPDYNQVEISIADNGSGIPENIKEKIFQPFFTTKATGQGTGLGLSLSYDIIKAHGGEIRVESKEGEGTEFMIRLPLV